MGLRFTVLASGSTGNALVVGNEQGMVLVDAGLSMKKLEQLLMERQVQIRELRGVFVTHEHTDHIKGLGALARKYDLPVYANERTWAEMESALGTLDDRQKQVLPTDSEINIDSLRIESYGISHDAVDPVGFCFHSGGQKLSLATDLGYVSPKVKEKIKDSDVLILEANHDIGMLRMGRYPWNIKMRILGDLGHLSNEAAGEVLCELVTNRLRRVYLAHLSRDHNLMDLARLTVNNIVEEAGFSLAQRKLSLVDTYHDRPTKWDDLDLA